MPFDLRTLRSFRCLRPLKMVSKVPSKFIHKFLLQAELDKVETYVVAEDIRLLVKISKIAIYDLKTRTPLRRISYVNYFLKATQQQSMVT